MEPLHFGCAGVPVTSASPLTAPELVATRVLIAVIVVGSALAGRLDAEAMGLANLAVVVGFALLLAQAAGQSALFTNREANAASLAALLPSRFSTLFEVSR